MVASSHHGLVECDRRGRRCGGCAAKWGGAPLSGLVRELAASADDALLVGLAPFDDAAVYRVGDDLAVVSTTDFFPPLVDDPADFGAIAAANACSDVFAMGGRVTMALNVAAFPERLPVAAIEAILQRRWGMMVSARGIAPACDISLVPLADAVAQLNLVDVERFYDTDRYAPKRSVLTA